MSPKSLTEILGIEQTSVSHTERLVSALGGLVSIIGILLVSRWVLQGEAATMIIASMGATAVLLFAVPHGTLSQPWAVFAGHLISAIIGVICTLSISPQALAAGIAVGAAIGVMYYLKCIHPPGGATALAAVLGGDATRELGFQFVLTPVMLNVFIIVTIAVLFNYPFQWRRYPNAWRKKDLPTQSPSAEVNETLTFSHEDFEYALEQMDSYVDITEQEMRRIFELIRTHSQQTDISVDQLTLGSFYSNGEYGKDWTVRQIVDEYHHSDPNKEMVVYKTVAGNGRHSSGYMEKTRFCLWAKHEVIRDNENWKRVVPGPIK
ncbi:MAG: HPP family protein [Gammaproteobacteria bacterium]|nr:HPP family protein [Gammaproteobacteria bacterium]MDH5801660.1 HPP family protein [Gammaproteobacteria bacterium]